MTENKLSQIEQEYIVFYALHQACAQTAARIAQHFDSMNAFVLDPVDNEFIGIAKSAVNMAAEIRQVMIEGMPNANKMMEFLRNNELKLSWEPK